MTRESSPPHGAPPREARTVLTTGANSGIGLATVLELARRGFRSVCSVRSEEKARALERAAAEAGVKVETVLLDVTDAARCARVIDELRPWGLVNNAGYSLNGAVEDVSDEEARHLLETVVLAPMRLARLALPHMRDAGGGRIVNVSSIYGRTTTPLTGWYQGAKHALEATSACRARSTAGAPSTSWRRWAAGRSAAPYTLSDMAADGAGLLDALGIDAAHVVGASLGGMIAQTLAIEHPRRVLSLTSIMTTTGNPRLPRARPEAAAALLEPPPRDRDSAMAFVPVVTRQSSTISRAVT